MIDAHLHLWDPTKLDYDWLRHVPEIAHRHGPENWIISGGDVRQAVFVQSDCAPAQALDEVDWVASLDDPALEIMGVVAFAPLEQGDRVRPHLDALTERSMVRGVRRSVQNEADEFILAADHIDGLVATADMGLTIDVCARDHQLPDLIAALDRLFAKAPDARVVLDHLGKPEIKASGGDIHHLDWSRNLERLAERPQIFAKVSGLTTQDDWRDGRDETLRPYIDHALATFGPERLMYGGDWPVVDLAGGLPRWRSIFDAAIAELSDDERDLIRHGTARRFYCLSAA